jgi:hypothetical protein
MLQIGRIRGRDRTRQTFVIGAVLGVSVLVLSVFNLGTVHAEAVNCDANAVIAGGAASVSALQQKYTNGTSCVSGGVTYSNKAYSIQDVYHAFGMAPSDISAMSSDAQEGYVTKTGDVYVGSTLVATGAYTAGRQNIAGSTSHHYGQTTYYQRPTSVSFQDSKLSAMVIMKNGVFAHAILHSCGNPVNATPKTTPPPPAPPKTPAPTPFYKCVELTGAIVDKSTMTFSFTATASFGNGATFSEASFNFGDGHAQSGVQPATGSPDSVTVTHAYTTASTFNATAVLHFNVNGRDVTAAACPAVVTATTPPTPECKPGIPVGSAMCTPCPTDTSVPANQCPVTPPPALPNTGAGDTIAVFGAVVVVGFLVYRQFIFRKHRAAFLAAQQGTSPLPLGDPLNQSPDSVVAAQARRHHTFRRKRQF